MPIYEYRCRECGHEFSRLVSMGTADEDIACPHCGVHAAERQISTFFGTTGGSGSGGGSCGSGGGFT
jgi:putative FmdB family regulatory protein